MEKMDSNGMRTAQLATKNWAKGCVCVCVLGHFSHVQLFATLWTVVQQAPLSMGFSRQEYWSGLPCSLPGDLSNPGIEPESPESPALQADSLPAELSGKTEVV